MTAPNDATLRQIEAAQPNVSTWLSANAGSGKTRVLTDRVARLLLDGVSPENILCLTYTKAAATEMQNRLFKRLGAWAMRDSADLFNDLIELGVDRDLDETALRHARTLFAKAIETPGGLKIQTIHSFCATLLRRFPLEAGVSPQFAEADERSIRLLIQDILESMARTPALGDIMTGIARYSSDTQIEDLLKNILSNRHSFNTPENREYIAKRFGAPASGTMQQAINDHFDDADIKLVRDLIPHLNASGTNDQKAAVKLVAFQSLEAANIALLESVFLNGAKAKAPFQAKIDSFPTKACRSGPAAALVDDLNDLMTRVEDFRNIRLAIEMTERTTALHAFAAEFLPRFEREKQLRGWLDFDDLISKARDLLTNPLVAEWVLYRLDGGIDHILVDEAQDTSPIQWDVIEKLAQEFTSGQGARADVTRTIFVVGDKKQSIYSFQGADPREFDRMRDTFAERLKATNQPFQPLSLEYSFRSSAAILSVVDNTFDGRGASGFAPDSKHRAFKDTLPGRVDLWPVIEKTEQVDDENWYDPVDKLGASDYRVQLAERIASYIHTLIARGELIPDGDGARPIRAGDIMILVQRRSELFDEIIRACKQRGLPMAGADRLKVQEEMAVRDLIALLSFLATPEDDLSLAVVLKSPLFGWDEQRLFDLAHRRKSKYLWTALRDQADLYPNEVAILNDLRDNTDFLRPYDLLEQVLTKYDGRKRLVGRLGSEAVDAIDTLLSQALIYEQSETPSLTGFLTWIGTDELDIKRQLDSNSNEIRVMTVHGSKGLESPIVILPDTAKRELRLRDDILKSDDGFAFWKTSKDNLPQLGQDAYEDRVLSETQERDRLLYVAMTRAEKWLIVAASGDLGGTPQSWYEQVQDGMVKTGAVDYDFGFGTGLRVSHMDWPTTTTASDTKSNKQIAPLPEWVAQSAPAPQAVVTHVSPSNLGGAKAIGGSDGRDEDAAMLFGSQVHALLEHLPNIPAPQRAARAASILDGYGISADHDALSAIMGHVEPVLGNADLSWIFEPDTLTEIGISAHLDGDDHLPIYGVIDRLCITEQDVHIIDYKTNAVVPESPDQIPQGILRQMAAYQRAVMIMYPDHAVHAGILWTANATYMPIPDMFLVHTASEHTSS